MIRILLTLSTVCCIVLSFATRSFPVATEGELIELGQAIRVPLSDKDTMTVFTNDLNLSINGLFARAGNRYGYWNADSARLLTPYENYLLHNRHSLPPVVMPFSLSVWHAGVMTSDGEVICPPDERWNAAGVVCADCGLLRVTRYRWRRFVKLPDNHVWIMPDNTGIYYPTGISRSGLIRKDGSCLLPVKYDFIDAWAFGGVMRFCIRPHRSAANDVDRQNGMRRAGLVNIAGQFILRPGYYRYVSNPIVFNASSAMSTSDIRPYFCVRKGRRYGVIDRTGALVHPLSRAENMEDFMTRYNVTAFLKEYDARFDAE